MIALILFLMVHGLGLREAVSVSESHCQWAVQYMLDEIETEEALDNAFLL